MDLDQKPVRISSTKSELFINGDDLAGLLKVSANELSYLTRSKIISRYPHPTDARAYVYPAWDSMTRYIVWIREKREAMRLEFLKEKALTQREQRIRLELQNGVNNGRLVEKARLLQTLEPLAVLLRNAVLTRADRLERAVTAAKGRKAKLAVIRRFDLEVLQMFADLVKPLKTDQNGQNGDSVTKTTL
jgi:hypothetical protein